MRCLIAIVGPTAIGKSRFGVALAGSFNGEIINADSRQIYRYMDIGTAKPGREERQQVPHHLLDIIDPDQAYSVALYQAAAHAQIERLQSAGKIPIMVGGSGQYVWSVIEGWQIPPVEPDHAYRDSLERRAAAEGAWSLYRQLGEIDPVAAARIDPNNLRRVIRALEIYRLTGRKPSELQAKHGVPYPVLMIGITTKRHNLYTLIDLRADRMMEDGLVDEVKKLRSMGYSADLPSMSSLGYKQIAQYVDGEMDLATALQRIKHETHRFSRSQYAWFRPGDSRIKWFSIEDNPENEINYTIKNFIVG